MPDPPRRFPAPWSAARAIMPVAPLVRPTIITESVPRADPSNARIRRRVGLSS
jgi:hypothetical protein